MNMMNLPVTSLSEATGFVARLKGLHGVDYSADNQLKKNLFFFQCLPRRRTKSKWSRRVSLNQNRRTGG